MAGQGRKAGRPLFPMDDRTALPVRSGQPWKPSAGEMEVLRGKPPGRQEKYPNLKRGSQKSLVGVTATRQQVHRNTARRRLLRAAGQPEATAVASARAKMRAALRQIADPHFDRCQEDACHSVRLAREWLKNAASAIDAHKVRGA